MPIVTGHIAPIRAGDLRWPTSARRTFPDWRCRRLSAAELERFVIGVVNGDIFLADQVEPRDDVGCVFPALSFLHEITPDAQREIGTFFEFASRAIGRARNGQPSFLTVQFLHRDDWSVAKDMIAAEVLRRERQSR